MVNKTRKKVPKGMKIVGIIATVLVIAVVAGVMAYSSSMSAVDPSDTEIRPFEVKEGDTYSSLGTRLKEEGFIKSETAYKLFIRSNEPEDLYVGKYPLSPSMDLREIVAKLGSGETYHPDEFFLTFPEGKNMRYIVSLIAENTDNTEEDMYALLKDEEYLDRLLEDYWFLLDNIKDIFFLTHIISTGQR